MMWSRGLRRERDVLAPAVCPRRREHVTSVALERLPVGEEEAAEAPVGEALRE